MRSKTCQIQDSGDDDEDKSEDISAEDWALAKYSVDIYSAHHDDENEFEDDELTLCLHSCSILLKDSLQEGGWKKPADQG